MLETGKAAGRGKKWRDTIKVMCSKECLDFAKLNKKMEGGIEAEETENEELDDAEDDHQLDQTFYERGKPIISELDFNRRLVAVELRGMIDVQTEEEAGVIVGIDEARNW